MNYFEHEQRVKYIDGVLSRSQDWEWLINYIEENFSVELTVNSFNDFKKVFSKIKDIFNYFISINQFVNKELRINQEWLEKIYEFSLYYIGKIQYEQLQLNNDFEKVFELLIYLAKLNNETSDQKLMLYYTIIEQKNLYKIRDISAFIREETDIINRIQAVSFDTSKELDIFKSNINQEFADCSEVLKQKRSDLVSVNCFSFQRLDDVKAETWEESYLIDMVGVEYKNKELIPMFGYDDGASFPDFNQWTEEVLDIMKTDFNNEDADFIIESIKYMIYGYIPNESVILKHINLLSEYYDQVADDTEKNYDCSSLEILLSLLSNKDNSFSKEIISEFNKTISKITDFKKLIQIDSRYPIRNKKIKAKIEEYINNKIQKVDAINNYSSFKSFITDSDIIPRTDNKTFDSLSDVFDGILQNCDNNILPYLFLDYLEFLLKIKNNRKIISGDISKEINYIRHLWKDEYYEKSFSSMQTYKNSISVEKADAEKFDMDIIDNPYGVAYNCMKMSEKAIINTIEIFSNHPLLCFVSRVILSEDFPKFPKIIIDGKHEIDLYYKERVEKTKKDNAYKFLNNLKLEEVLPFIYDEIKNVISISFYMFNRKDVLYQEVQQINPDYSLLDYSEEPTLAHLMQLFPILECKIREIGECYGIAPIREDIKHYNKLKDPTTVIKKIVKMVYEETQSLEQVADFIFIFFTMFAENGINIRNNCVHGVSFNKDKNEIDLAFKITLFCLHLIEYRFSIIKSNLTNEAETSSEQTEKH